MRGFMKIKNRRQLADISRGIENWLKRNGKSYLLDKHLPLTDVSSEKSKAEVLMFCEKYKYIPNQKSKNKTESKLGYLASYYKRMDPVFKDKLHKFNTIREHINQLKKREIINFLMLHGHKPTTTSKTPSVANHFKDKKFMDLYNSYPTITELNLSTNIKRIKSTCFSSSGEFTGTDYDRKIVHNNREQFPEYKIRNSQESWTKTLNDILNFCIINKRCPKRGLNGILMETASEEERLASKLGDVRKYNKKGRFNDKNRILFDKIEEFREINDKTRYSRIKEIVSRKCINLDTKKIFNSITEAARYCGMKSGSGINWCCRGKAKTAGGYRWAYCDEKGNIIK
jgi:hypothetical protein